MAMWILVGILLVLVPGPGPLPSNGDPPPTIPNLLCRAGRALYVNGRTLSAELSKTDRLYAIRHDSLFISDPGKPEFHYNNLTLPQPFRATTYYFTIHFTENRYEGPALVVQEFGGDAQIVQVQCAAAAP
jgi:hypothetical protein